MALGSIVSASLWIATVAAVLFFGLAYRKTRATRHAFLAIAALASILRRAALDLPGTELVPVFLELVLTLAMIGGSFLTWRAYPRSGHLPDPGGLGASNRRS